MTRPTYYEKAITIHSGEHSRLVSLLSAGGFESIANQLAQHTWEPFPGGYTRRFAETFVPELTIELGDGSIVKTPFNQFHCTGMAPSLSEALTMDPGALGTIGYFRSPSGHLCSSDCLPRYRNGQP